MLVERRVGQTAGFGSRIGVPMGIDKSPSAVSREEDSGWEKGLGTTGANADSRVDDKRGIFDAGPIINSVQHLHYVQTSLIPSMPILA